MKKLICTLLFVFILMSALGACSQDKTGTPDVQTSALETGDTTVKDVLVNGGTFICADDSKTYKLDDYLLKDSSLGTTYTASRFTQVDFDSDGAKEVVLELSVAEPVEYLILHSAGGKIYGYNVTLRAMQALATDGTFTYANSADDTGVQKISAFKTNKLELETLATAKGTQYTVNGASATKDEYDAFDAIQQAKTPATWLNFTAENLITVD